MRLHWAANLAMLRSPRAVAGFLALGLAPALCWILAAEIAGRALAAAHGGLGTRLLGDPRLDAYLLLSPGWLLAQHAAFMEAMRRWYTPFVRIALGDLGHPVCLVCGHRLAPGSRRCPECGAPSGET